MKTLRNGSLNIETTPSTNCRTLHEALRIASQNCTAQLERAKAEDLICTEVRTEVRDRSRLRPWDSDDLAQDVGIRLLNSAREGSLPLFLDEPSARAFVRTVIRNRRNDYFRKVNARAKSVTLGISESNDATSVERADRPCVGQFDHATARRHVSLLAHEANALSKQAVRPADIEAALAIAFDECEQKELVESNRKSDETFRTASNRTAKRLSRARHAILAGSAKVASESDREMLVEFFGR